MEKCKRVLATGLCLTMVLSLGQSMSASSRVFAEEVEKTVLLSETFDEYENTDSLKGYTFGSPTLSLVENGEGKALKVSERTANYYAYAISADDLAGNTVEVSFDVKLDTEVEEPQRFGATIKTTKDGEDDNYDQVAAKEIENGDMVTIVGTYDVPAQKDSYVIYFETSENVDYVIDNITFAVVGEYKKPSNEVSYVDFSEYPSLKELYKDYFKMGVACEAISHWNNSLSEIGNETKEALMLKEFNSITFGNELKPDYNMGYNSPDKTETDLPFVIDKAAKEMLDWAKANGMPVRGHVLVWHSQCNDAIFCKDYTPVYLEDGKTLDPACFVSKEVMEARLESYINHVFDYMYANGYGEVIYAWDVVNEAVEPGTNEFDLRDSYWYKVMGSDFIYDSFKYARAAEIAASEKYGIEFKPALFYNDYNEYMPTKRDAIIANVKKAKEDGLIDGIGMQAHLSDVTDIDSFITALRMYDEAVGEVHVTELDVSTTGTGINAELDNGIFYNKLFKELIAARKDGVNLTSVTIWGLTDDNSWKKESKPLIFRGDLSAKYAFTGIVNAATGEEMPAPQKEEVDFTDVVIDFEDGANTLRPRGDGTLEVQSEVVANGNYALKDSGRTATWNGVSVDVSKFAGQTIAVSANVKSEAAQIKLSADIDGQWPNIATVDSTNEWTEISGVYKMPKELKSLSLYFEADDLSDIYVDDIKITLVGLDEGFETKENIASPRGVGHMPVCIVTDETAASGEKSYKVTRSEQDATMKFDISKYIGNRVKVSAKVKALDSQIMMGLDGATPTILAKADSVEGEFTEISCILELPEALTSASMFIETDGAKDFYVDDIAVRITDEEPKHEHSYQTVVTDPTCEAAGFTTYTCECGESYVADEVEVLGHIEAEAVEENRVEPTHCAEGSVDKVVYCSRCNNELSRTTEVLEKTPVTQEEVAAAVENAVKEVIKAVGRFIKKFFGWIFP